MTTIFKGFIENTAKYRGLLFIMRSGKLLTMKKIAHINFLFTAIIMTLVTTACSNQQSKGIEIYNQGVAYYNKMDYAKALQSFQKAADMGVADGACGLGVMYETGKGVAINYQKAMQLYLEAAHEGHSGAMYNLGLMYEKGLGVVPNNLEAMEWYKKGAKAGSTSAANNLALLREKMR